MASTTDTTEKYNIICLSNQLWDFTNPTNKYHVMSRLAKLGHNVLYVDPPINTGNVFLRQVLRGFWNLRRLLTQYKKDKTGAYVYTPLNLVPFPKITSRLHVSKINSLSKKYFDSNNKTLLWVYHVQIEELESYLNNLNYDFLIYDCVDNYSGFPENSDFYSTTVSKSKVEEQERNLTHAANIVFATAPGLVEKLKTYSDKVYYTPNVGDYEKFKDSKKIKELPIDIKDISRPIIGFYGALDEYKFDYDLFKKIVTENPDYSFVIIGQIALKDKEAKRVGNDLKEFENVYFLGSKPYKILQNYVAGFDAFIIPYVLNDYTVGGCFPVKFHEGLAAGLPTIVTDLPAYLPFKDVSYISKTYEEFSSNIRTALIEDNDNKIKQRQIIAKENSWSNKVATMLALIAENIK